MTIVKPRLVTGLQQPDIVDGLCGCRQYPRARHPTKTLTAMAPTDVIARQRSDALQKLSAATAEGSLTPVAANNISSWLTEPRYEDYASQVAQHVLDGQWETLEQVFWTTIPFGTAGRRGRMYPIGTNAINDRTMGETVQATAEYVAEYARQRDERAPLSCAIGYDTRHRSRHFAELCAEIMLAHGFEIQFLDGPRATPLLSTTIRQLGCACGIMVTASHNPPADNAAKVFWSTGAQLRSPHDRAVTERLDQVEAIRREPFADACRAGRVHFCQDEMQSVYEQAVLQQGCAREAGTRQLRILFSPLHGVGASSIVPVLAADGFADVEVFGPHAEPNGDFPNVPNHIANPESPAVFDAMIEHAQTTGHQLVLASDPDADRIGCAAPIALCGDTWQTFNGNQIGVMIADYVLSRRQSEHRLTPDHYLIKTLVTTDMYYRLGAAFNVRVHGACLTGFKWIGSLVDQLGPDHFVMGTEEAHGYLLGTYARDKDAAVAAMLLAELADEALAASKSLHDVLNDCYRKYGFHEERTISKIMPGAGGMERMQAIMDSLREQPPHQLAGIPLVEFRDYLTHTVRKLSGDAAGESAMKGPDSELPPSNLIVLRGEDGRAWAAIRPSGTEPKIKFYLFVSATAAESADLEATKGQLGQLLARLEHDLLAHVENEK